MNIVSLASLLVLGFSVPVLALRHVENEQVVQGEGSRHRDKTEGASVENTASCVAYGQTFATQPAVNFRLSLMEDNRTFSVASSQAVITLADSFDGMAGIACSFAKYVPGASLYIFTPREVAASHFANGTGYKNVQVVPYDPVPGQHAQALRWGLFLDFIEANPDIKQVAICDAFDVIFQADPFAGLPANRLLAFSEVNTYSIGTEKSGGNRVWVQTLYGDEVMHRMFHKPVLNMGYIMADSKSMLAYLRKVQSEIRARLLPRLEELCRKFKFNFVRGMDQGVHNVVLHDRAIPGVTVDFMPWDNEIAVMGNGIFVDRDVSLNGTTIVRKGDGVKFRAVHQYNRIGDLSGMAGKNSCKNPGAKHCGECTHPWL